MHHSLQFSIRGHQSRHFGPLSEVQRPLRGRRRERELLLLGAAPLPLEAARGRRLRALLRLGLPLVAVASVGGEFEDVVGRGDGGQVGAVPEANFQIFIQGVSSGPDLCWVDLDLGCSTTLPGQ